MHSDCIDEEEEGNSLGLRSLGHVIESAEPFPPLEEPSLHCCSLQNPAGFGLPSAADLTAVSAAEEFRAPTASRQVAATAVGGPEALAASSDVAATAVEEAETITASSGAAATAVEEPATPEGCSSLSLLTTHTSSASDSLPDLPLPPLSSLTLPLPSPSSSGVGFQPALALSPSPSSSAATAGGLCHSSPFSALPSLPCSSKALLDPFCLPLISETAQEDLQKIPEGDQEDSQSQQQPCSPQRHHTNAQTVCLCEGDKCALLKELAGIQVKAALSISRQTSLSCTYKRNWVQQHRKGNQHFPSQC